MCDDLGVINKRRLGFTLRSHGSNKTPRGEKSDGLRDL